MKLLCECAKYEVSLISGDVYLLLPNMESGIGTKVTSTLIQADFYSLNILRQNLAEAEFKGCAKSVMVRTVLGEKHKVPSDQILPMMKYIKEKYPEEFV